MPVRFSRKSSTALIIFGHLGCKVVRPIDAREHSLRVQPALIGFSILGISGVLAMRVMLVAARILEYTGQFIAMGISVFVWGALKKDLMSKKSAKNTTVRVAA
ncbi:hypothetical protein O988_08063 [Pseudogymnoascus sp. VKM F-3808]|nr:hypothetical protein O988_08063 [Pseudogymnoascus sp. VKM F-3808]